MAGAPSGTRAGTPAGTPDCHRPLFALRPPPQAVAAIGAVRDSLGRGGGLRDDRLHMTLLMIDDVAELHPALGAALVAVGGAVVAEAPDIVLDRLVIGRGHAVLVPAAPPAALHTFQAMLAGALERIGITVRRGWRFSPHVTLGYRKAEPADRAIEPIRWTATDFVLLDSWVGLTHHEPIGSWALG